MIRILICDDDSVFAEVLQEQVNKAFSKHHLDTQICCCNSGKALQTEFEKLSPDLVFLDLMLQDADGYQLAHEIRNAHAKTEIVFITNYPERMPDAFAYKPIGFIPKPGTAEDITSVINRFLLYYWDLMHYYAINTREQTIRIPVGDIVYFESSGHQVLIHCKSQTDPIYQVRRLDEIAEELQEFAFLRIHKSFLVHIDSVLRLDKTNMCAHLKNGKTLPISRSQYSDAVEQFIHYQLR